LITAFVIRFLSNFNFLFQWPRHLYLWLIIKTFINVFWSTEKNKRKGSYSLDAIMVCQQTEYFVLWEPIVIGKKEVHMHTSEEYWYSWCTLHYITLHYITLHYITLHYSTLHYISFTFHWSISSPYGSGYETCHISMIA
jgi:hypothetical protein